MANLMSNDNQKQPDAELQRMTYTLEKLHADSVLCHLYYRLLYWHQVLCMIPLGLAFLLVLILPSENMVPLPQVFMIQVPIFLSFWLGEAVLLRHFMTLPEMTVAFKDVFKPSIDHEKSVKCVHFGRISFSEILTSPYLYSNYGGWIVMFVGLSAILSIIG